MWAVYRLFWVGAIGFLLLCNGLPEVDKVKNKKHKQWFKLSTALIAVAVFCVLAFDFSRISQAIEA